MRRGPALRAVLDSLYARYTNPSLIRNDPLSVPRRFPALEDREIVALVAAGLAYGRVAQITRNLETLMQRLSAEPSRFVMESSEAAIRRAVLDFQHRWSRGEEVADLLLGVRRMRERFGTLEASFLAGVEEEHDSVLPALSAWVREVRGASAHGSSLLSDPARGSACKRLHLFLRWMVRNDAVDPGGWTRIPPARLVAPVDVHMHRVGRALGFTRRRDAGLRTALDITAGFRAVHAEDPIRYDFALTRPGILQAIDLRDVVRGARGDPARLLAMPLPSSSFS